MKLQELFLYIFTAVLLFFIGREDWQMLIPIPLAILNGYINSRAIAKHRVGKKWHIIQLLTLSSLCGILVATKAILWDELALVVALYYTAFEISLNKFNGQVWNYVGQVAWLDRLQRRITKTEGKSRTLFAVIKLMLVFAGMSIYLANKPL